MNSPYDILGVSPNATDDEIRKAYRELAKKYHPDNYADSPLKETAEEKMAQINAAFDQIMAQRRGGGQSSSQQGYGGYGSQNSYQNASRFSDIRQMINQGRYVPIFHHRLPDEPLQCGVPCGPQPDAVPAPGGLRRGLWHRPEPLPHRPTGTERHRLRHL